MDISLQDVPTEKASKRVSVSRLTAACVDAARRGCAEIRRVQAKGIKKIDYKVAGDARSALTEADVRAQRVVTGSLIKTFGQGLSILGEEDGNEDAAVVDVSSIEPLNCDIVSFASVDEKDDIVLMENCCIIVDPVDGTREYCEGRLHHVQCLIGIAVNGRAIAGVIGLPFPSGAEGFSRDADADGSAIVYGIVGSADRNKGIVGCYNEHLRSPRRRKIQKDECDFIVTTGDSSSKILKAAREAAFEVARTRHKPGHFVQGGCGNKMLSVAEDCCDCALNHFGTCVWDTCAPEAILRASGGKVTDLFGAPLIHKKNARSLVNELGVVATSRQSPISHDTLCSAMRECTALFPLFHRAAGFAEASSAVSGAQAFDVARALDGAPLTLSYLSSAIGNVEGTLKGYAAHESTAVRGLMSDAVRLSLQWSEESASPLPRSVFYKRVDLPNLSHMKYKLRTAPMKVARDVESFRVESSFIGSSAARALANAGVGIPRAFACAADVARGNIVDSKFALLVEDFSPEDGWFQVKCLNLEQAQAAVAALAKQHAFFLPDASYRRNGNDTIARELSDALWPSGCYWQPSMQPMKEHVGHLAERYAQHMESFRGFIDELKAAHPVNRIEEVGERLASVAYQVGDEAFPFSKDNSAVSSRVMKQQTVVHGDPKAGNIFLRKQGNGNFDVSFIDFQWSGFGLPGTDLGHFLCASVAEGALRDDGTSLIDLYFERFIEYADLFGAKGLDIMTKDELIRQCETAILDTCRCIFAYHWFRSSACPEMQKRNADSIGRNSYNKSKFNAMWIVKRVDQILTKRGI